ncbi:MAG: peptide chain release factor N(5)-glutamine methyltransferase [Clostridia bacterium]|nr:peptide chain release factor N(5)-glutamine methyltransferase [Clostridia bacterium]
MAKTKIGGQAVLEGVMMRGESSVALAVRNQRKEIVLETQRIQPAHGVRKIPFIRGVFNLFSSFYEGSKQIMKATDIWAEDDEQEISKGSMKAVSAIGLILGVVLAVVLFIWIPEGITKLLFNSIGGRVDASGFGLFFKTLFATYDIAKSQVGLLLLWNLTAGLIKVGIFILYLTLITLMPDIKRLFMYHGSEHKTINCYESEWELTIENVQKSSAYHDRCGTAFIFFVILVSILVTSIVQIWLGGLFVWQKVILKLLLLLPIMSLSYELLMFNARHDWWILRPLKWLGRGMQKLTTRPPTDDMVEVAITSFKAVLAMDKDPSIKPVAFPKVYTVAQYLSEAKQKAKKADVEEASVEWLLCEVLKIKRSALGEEKTAKRKLYIAEKAKLDGYLAELLTHKPLQYVLGNQQFFEFEFKVTPDTLIPRPETEELTQIALEHASADSAILDMCCGCGCIGEAIAKKCGASVVASDISEKALEVAQDNAKLLGVTDKVRFVRGDLFENVEGKFDIIVCNPPYVSPEEYEDLSPSVKEFEPKLALVADKDGYSFYFRIHDEVRTYMKENSLLIMECGIAQAQTIADIFKDFDTQIRKDDSGVERFVLCRL